MQSGTQRSKVTNPAQGAIAEGNSGHPSHAWAKWKEKVMSELRAED